MTDQASREAMIKPDPKEMIAALDMLHKHCPLEIVNEVQIAVFSYLASLEAGVAQALEQKTVIPDGEYKFCGRVIRTSFVHPPIPDRSQDWDAIFPDNYDDGQYIGRGKTEAEAVIDLIENEGLLS